MNTNGDQIAEIFLAQCVSIALQSESAINNFDSMAQGAYCIVYVFV